ncbi:hypothetical protein [Actinoplanes sp. NPDC051494]|uniref:hypothetical protein n=1 Tax=Actinoplanes sp. NPDC051494 TaxID=3363907 RepID=UPI00378B6B24
MGDWLIAFVFSIPLVAFGMWLTFNAILVKWHGLEALKETPAVYRAFDPRRWSRHGLPAGSTDPRAPEQSPPPAA